MYTPPALLIWRIAPIILVPELHTGRRRRDRRELIETYPEGVIMGKPSRLALKLNELRRMLVSLPGFSIRALFMPPGITLWIGQAVRRPSVHRAPLQWVDGCPIGSLPPRRNAFISAVHRTRGILVLWPYVRVIQENLHYSDAKW